MSRIQIALILVPIFLLVNVISGQTKTDSICGKYICVINNNYTDTAIIIIKPNGRYKQSIKSGFLSDKNWSSGKGKWEIKGDSIYLSRLYFVSKDQERRSFIPHRFGNMYVITNENSIISPDRGNGLHKYCKNYR